ncbi:MAG: hypothetical protein F4Y91_02255, partial [Gemmatimonadetes bacterium]|nr:hypothetical protein [Gemmatimonadota bacterium]
MTKFRMYIATLFSLLLIGNAYADSVSDLTLAQKFSPILILTEKTSGKYGNIRVIKPEPVNIVSAQYADSIKFNVHNSMGQSLPRPSKGFNWSSLSNWDPPLSISSPKIDISQDRFSFLFHRPKEHHYYKYFGRPLINEKQYSLGTYFIAPYFDYPGEGPTSWNNTYFGTGPHAGENENFPNTSYVHIYETTHDTYADSITVIQYFYFYPYNHWWNNHEGDWPRVNVVVNSRNPNDENIKVLGVEYLFHGAHLSYYDDYFLEVDVPPGVAGGGSPESITIRMPDLTSRFVFNPRQEIRLSEGTHPVIYVGAGSHASYPTGGNYTAWEFPEVLFSLYDTPEHITHTGLVLRTQIDNSYPSLQENYGLVLLPKPDTSRTNMGLPNSLSWLGADVLWGTPVVSGRGDTKSPRGPYYAGWEKLNFFQQSATGPNFPLLADRINYSFIPHDHTTRQNPKRPALRRLRAY